MININGRYLLRRNGVIKNQIKQTMPGSAIGFASDCATGLDFCLCFDAYSCGLGL